jgi:hypothetical protein
MPPPNRQRAPATKITAPGDPRTAAEPRRTRSHATHPPNRWIRAPAFSACTRARRSPPLDGSTGGGAVATSRPLCGRCRSGESADCSPTDAWISSAAVAPRTGSRALASGRKEVPGARRRCGAGSRGCRPDQCPASGELRGLWFVWRESCFVGGACTWRSTNSRRRTTVMIGGRAGRCRSAERAKPT